MALSEDASSLAKSCYNEFSNKLHCLYECFFISSEPDLNYFISFQNGKTDLQNTTLVEDVVDEGENPQARVTHRTAF